MAGNMQITAKVPVRLVNPLNQREHWAVKAKRAKGQRSAAWIALFRQLQPIKKDRDCFSQITITITRRGGRRMDDDGLTASAKHVRDGIADYLGIDDGDKRLKWVYAQDKAPKGEHFVTVSIEFE